MFVGISGIIGAGKTTLTRGLAERFGCRAYYEPVVENVYLADFYTDMKRWGAMMQLYLLAKRFEQHQQVVWSGQGAVQDRTIYEDTIFARMLRDQGVIDDRDYATYMDHFNVMKRFLVYPDILIYLRVAPGRALQRIHRRGRDIESGITLGYLEKLTEGYEQFASEMSRWTRVLTLDWNDYGSVDDVARMVREELAENLHFLRDLKRI